VTGRFAQPPLPKDLWVRIAADAQAAIVSLVDSFERRIAVLEIKPHACAG
jgi:hypothetical protein